MGGLRNYLALQVQARTGLGSGLFIWALLAVVFGTLTAGFILLIAFIWLAERYEPLTAAAALAGFFSAGHDYRVCLLPSVATPDD